MLGEISGSVSYFEDVQKTDKAKLNGYKDKMKEIASRLSALAEED